MRLHLKSHGDKHAKSAKDKLCCDWLKHDFASGTPTKNEACLLHEAEAEARFKACFCFCFMLLLQCK
jgi:hypothetical protein